MAIARPESWPEPSFPKCRLPECYHAGTGAVSDVAEGFCWCARKCSAQHERHSAASWSRSAIRAGRRPAHDGSAPYDAGQHVAEVSSPRWRMESSRVSSGGATPTLGSSSAFPQQCVLAATAAAVVLWLRQGDRCPHDGLAGPAAEARTRATDSTTQPADYTPAESSTACEPPEPIGSTTRRQRPVKVTIPPVPPERDGKARCPRRWADETQLRRFL